MLNLLRHSNYYYWLTWLFLLALVGCQPKHGKAQAESAPTQKEITIYGSNTCDHCIIFKAQLDSVGLKYVFLDVDHDEANTQELLDLIRSVNFKGYVSFPVVEVEGEVFVNPKIEVIVQKAQ